MFQHNAKGWVTAFFAVLVVLFGQVCPISADMGMNDANRTYSIRFQDWVYVYLNNEFLQAAPPAPDYHLSMTPKIVANKVRFVVTGYYFDTRLGQDWYHRYGSKLESTIAMICHSWTQQGYPISLDDFDIEIKEEKMNGAGAR